MDFPREVSGAAGVVKVCRGGALDAGRVVKVFPGEAFETGRDEVDECLAEGQGFSKPRRALVMALSGSFPFAGGRRATVVRLEVAGNTGGVMDCGNLFPLWLHGE